MKNGIVLFIVIVLISSCTVNQPVDTTQLPPAEVLATPHSIELDSLSNCSTIDTQSLLSDSLSKTHIVYQGYNEQWQPLLWVVSMLDGEKTLLEGYPGTVSGLGFLEDGQHFLIAIGDGKQAWLGNIDGTPVVKVDLTENLLSNFQAYSPIWSELVGLPEYIVDYRHGRYHSPNNQVIASWKPGDKALVLINRSTELETIVVSTGTQDTIYGRWTSDSKWFIFTYNYQTSDDYFGQLYKVNFEGTELYPMIEKKEGSFFVSPVLSPDNKKVVFIDSSVNDTLIVHWIDSGETRAFPVGLTIASSISDRMVWSPDSNWVALFTEWEQTDIRIVSVETGIAYCVTNDKIIENLMDWR